MFHPDENRKSDVREDAARMRLHRELLRGNGFYSSMVLNGLQPTDTADVVDHAMKGLSDDDANKSIRRRYALPTVNYLDMGNERFVDALMEEALPQDRVRFRRYLSERHLGLGLITAGPGFGKTTALAIGTVGMMNTLGNVYCTAPTPVTVDNFAARLHQVSCRVTERYNADLSDQDKQSHKLIIRGYKDKDEYEAFVRLLQFPTKGEDALPRSWTSGQSRWKLHLSVASWLLFLLGHPAVKDMCPGVPSKLDHLRERLESPRELRIRQVANGEIDWEEYDSGTKVEESTVMAWITTIIGAADAICTTANLSVEDPYKDWKLDSARCVAVDEAACISKPDLYTVWGNVLLPCLLAGDEKQLSPKVSTPDEEYEPGHAINRHAKDGKISPLFFLKSIGWPVFRLRVQLRMAKDLFALCHQMVYPDVPFEYAENCNIDNPQNTPGVRLEAYMKARFPTLRPAPAGTLQPVFVNCRDTLTFTDRVSKSKRNPAQVTIALDMLADLVRQTELNANNFAMISPYRANVKCIESKRRAPQYSNLAKMRTASTVGSFQGQEGEIVVIVMGTTKISGPGFTGDEARLNVMLSRQRCGLLIFGDINVAGDVVSKDGKGPGKGRGEGRERATAFRVVGNDGLVHWVKAGFLQNAHKALYNGGRVVEVAAPASA